jgi:hypothetical protein
MGWPADAHASQTETIFYFFFCLTFFFFDNCPFFFFKQPPIAPVATARQRVPVAVAVYVSTRNPLYYIGPPARHARRCSSCHFLGRLLLAGRFCECRQGMRARVSDGDPSRDEFMAMGSG